MPNYTGTIIANALQQSKVKGTPYVALQVLADTNLDTGEAVQRTFVASLWLTESAKVHTVETLRAIGFTGQSFYDLNNPCLEGLRVEISTDFESDQTGDRTYEKVSFVNAPGHYASRGIKPCSDAMARSIASSYDACLRNNPVNGGAARQPAPAAGAASRNAPVAQPHRTAAQRPAQGRGVAESDGFTASHEDDLPF